MESTLHEGSHVAVNKFSTNWSHVIGGDWHPKRGSIIIVKRNKNDKGDIGSPYIIKRAIGLPGERVVIVNGIVKIFNTDHPEGYLVEENTKWSKNISRTVDPNVVDITLALDEVFILGDNREESIDSRIIGPVKLSQVAGTVSIIL